MDVNRDCPFGRREDDHPQHLFFRCPHVEAPRFICKAELAASGETLPSTAENRMKYLLTVPEDSRVLCAHLRFVGWASRLGRMAANRPQLGEMDNSSEEEMPPCSDSDDQPGGF